MEVGENTVVTLLFTMADQNGEVLNDIHEHTPFRFVFGQLSFCPGLEKGVKGLSPGDAVEIIVSAAQAFGERDKDLVERVHKSELPEGAAVVGNLVRKLSDDGSASEPYTVIGFVGDWVHLDRNHPWAGKELHYTVKVLTVAPADGPIKIKPLRR